MSPTLHVQLSGRAAALSSPSSRGFKASMEEAQSQPGTAAPSTTLLPISIAPALREPLRIPGKQGEFNSREPSPAWAARCPRDRAHDRARATSTPSQEEPGQDGTELSPSLPPGNHPRDFNSSGHQTERGGAAENTGGEEEEEEAALTPAAKPKLPSRIRLWKKPNTKHL